eukprot:8852388-Ditylum_brightwellii.AAC.1
MENLGTSFADELLSVSGLTSGNEPKEKTIDIIIRKGEKSKLAETKTGKNNKKKHPFYTVEKPQMVIQKKR